MPSPGRPFRSSPFRTGSAEAYHVGVWQTVEISGSVQVLPCDDILVHRESAACPCAPKTTMLWTTALVVGTGSLKAFAKPMVTHNAMDGRDE